MCCFDLERGIELSESTFLLESRVMGRGHVCRSLTGVLLDSSLLALVAAFLSCRPALPLLYRLYA
jgi:hypothetical protein